MRRPVRRTPRRHQGDAVGDLLSIRRSPIDRAARARKAERPPSKAEQWARAVEGIQAATAPASAPSVAAVDEVLADHIRAEGSRPEQPEFVTDLELQRLRRDQAEWDEALARRRAARADLTTSRGG